MKNVVNRAFLAKKYICAFLLLLGTSAHAWGTGNGNNGDLYERISTVPSANDEIIFVNQAESYACGTTQNSNNRAVVSISANSTTHQYLYNKSEDAQVFVVKTGTSCYGFHTGSGYLAQKDGNQNRITTNSVAASTAPSAAYGWTMTVSSSVFSILNVNYNIYYLAFNGTDYFSKYKSSMTKPYIYKKVMSAPTAVAASSITSSGATITITDATNVNNYELYYSTSSTPPTAGSSATTTITGGKSKSITGLNANTTYYVWARAYSTSPARKTGWVALTGTTFKTAAASKTLSSIAITTQPTKRAYLVGQTFSKTGAVVRATYSDATTADVSSSATWTPTTGLVSGSNTITASYTEGGVTKTATTTVTGYSVTIQVKDVDGNTLSGVGAPTASATGASITASASGNNYVFKRWVAVTAAGTGFTNASNRSTTLTGTPTGAVTIKAEYYKPINITWNANGAAYTPGTPGTTQVGYGALMSSLTVPSPAPSTATFCGDKFVGWTTEENVAQDDDTGLNLFTSVAGNTTPITADMDFYAVFADYVTP